MINESLIRFHEERTQRISFTEEGHKYHVKPSVIDNTNPNYDPNINYTSATTLIKHFFPLFDEDIAIDRILERNDPDSKYYGMTRNEIKESWEDIRSDASGKGTAMHAYFEKIMRGEFDPEKDYNEKWEECRVILEEGILGNPKYDIISDSYVYAPEWRIFNEDYYICGSIDCVLWIPKMNQYVLVDWKRSKQIRMTSFNNEKGSHAITKILDNCNYVHYSIQLNIYKYILETKYKIKIYKMFIININPITKKCEVFEIENMTNIVKRMFEVERDNKLQNRISIDKKT